MADIPDPATFKDYVMGYKKETTFNTAVTPDTPIAVVRGEPNDEIENLENEGLDGNEGSAYVASADGRHQPDWRFESRLIAENFLNLAELGFGAQTGGNPKLKYPLPSATMEHDLVANVITQAGCVSRQFEIESSVEEQWARLRMEGLAASVTVGAAGSATDLVSSWPATEKPLLHRSTAYTWDGSAIRINRAVWRVRHALDEDDFSDNQTRQNIVATEPRVVEGELDCNWDTTNVAVYNSFRSGSFVPLVLTYSYGSSGTIVATFAKAKARGKLPSAGTGRFRAPIPFIAYNTKRTFDHTTEYEDAVSVVITADS